MVATGKEKASVILPRSPLGSFWLKKLEELQKIVSFAFPEPGEPPPSRLPRCRHWRAARAGSRSAPPRERGRRLSSRALLCDMSEVVCCCPGPRRLSSVSGVSAIGQTSLPSCSRTPRAMVGRNLGLRCWVMAKIVSGLNTAVFYGRNWSRVLQTARLCIQGSDVVLSSSGNAATYSVTFQQGERIHGHGHHRRLQLVPVAHSKLLGKP